MTAIISGNFTITPALTQTERDDLAPVHLNLLDKGDHTTVTTPDPDGHCDAAGFETELKNLVRRIGPTRVHGHVEVWGPTPGDLCRLGIVDGRVWAIYPHITWPQN